MSKRKPRQPGGPLMSVEDAKLVIEDARQRLSGDPAVLDEEGVLVALAVMQARAPTQAAKLLAGLQVEHGIAPEKVRVAIGQVAARLQAVQQSVVLHEDRPARTKVNVVGDLHERTQAVVKGLSDTNSPPTLFTHDDKLVVVTRSGSGPRSIETLTWQKVRAHIGLRLHCIVRDVGPDLVPTERTTDAPRDVAENLLALPDRPFPRLDGIVRVPFVSEDGHIYAEDGYIPERRLILDIGTRTYSVPSDPTVADVEAARGAIYELLVDFPFADNASRTNAVAVGLTLVTRPIIRGPVPFFFAMAAKQRTGKTLLLTSLCAAVTGETARIGIEPRNEDEWSKRILPTLMDPPPLAIVDNIKQRIVSGALAAVLTSTKYVDRLLGASKNQNVEAVTVWAGTGNNPIFDTDIAERVVPIRLQADSDDPGARSGFGHSLPHWAIQNSARLTAAFLTLASYGIRHSDKRSLPTMGGFEAWVETVGGILTACGFEDFLANRHEVRASDSESNDWRAIVELWAEAFGSKLIAARDLVDMLADRSPELLDVVLPGRGGSDPGAVRRASECLHRRVNQVWGPWQITAAGKDGHTKTMRYRLKAVPPAVRAGEAGKAANLQALTSGHGALADHAGNAGGPEAVVIAKDKLPKAEIAGDAEHREVGGPEPVAQDTLPKAESAGDAEDRGMPQKTMGSDEEDAIWESFDEVFGA